MIVQWYERYLLSPPKSTVAVRAAVFAASLTSVGPSTFQQKWWWKVREGMPCQIHEFAKIHTSPCTELFVNMFFFFHCSGAGQWICVAVHRGACGGKSCLCSYQQFGSIDRREDGHAGRWWRRCVYHCGPRHQLSVSIGLWLHFVWVITPVIQFLMPFCKD